MVDLRGELRREGTRVANRLHALGPARLGRVDDVGQSPADRAHVVGQHLADLAADAVGRRRQQVPRLADHAVGDQITVLTDDVLSEGDAAALHAALAQLGALRRTL